MSVPPVLGRSSFYWREQSLTHRSNHLHNSIQQADMGDMDDFLGGNDDDKDADDVGDTFEEEDSGTAKEDDDAAFDAPVASKEEKTEEASVLVKFRANWRNRCIEKDREGAEKKKELVEKAQEALNDFNATREDHKSRRKATNRDSEKDFLAQIDSEKESDNSWSRVVGMVDTKDDADGADISRMRSILIQLKNKPLVASKTSA